MDHRLIEGLALLSEAERGRGTKRKHAPLRMVLAYPSPYRAAMSSLGYLQIHRLANARPGTMCERAMLPEPDTLVRHKETRTPLLTIESQSPAGDADVIGDRKSVV